ncbi:MAG: GTP-binding protein [Firmicutes bacterium]|nr:GTP-binding protein [Bacillota bacterium]
MLVDIVNGFLGSGKTTFIRHIARQLVPLERIVILVNEFGEVGIDGALLTNEGLGVVELTSGCICCSLAPDLGRQLLGIATGVNPDRVIIEPTGVATIQGLLSVVGSLKLEKYIEAVKVIFLIDAAEFKDFQSGYPAFLEAQISLAHTVIINKCDLVSEADAREIRQTISTINPQATVLSSTFGQVALEQMGAPPAQGDLYTGGGGDTCHRHLHHHHNHEKRVPTYQSFSRLYEGLFDPDRLIAFFRDLAQSGVMRAKGIFRCPEGWQRIDFVPSTGVITALLAGSFDNSRVLIIGSGLNPARLAGSLEKCRLATA